ncbi:heme exporter protein CcmD [Rhizobium oryzicola]|uniref:Heme exporter protein D n=1 Tax=Rhizobium oryzicola TaxID=1232668 RepID=A0ABT8T255_9HYPH|nr:heme exporter protein CcmD [Rhizobium oryzicola]MDO1583972.1 heme exporter protein CcmD [Rhizobium oryzicola]
MSHAFYVYSSYLVALAITAIAILWTWADGRARQRELAELEAAGVRRRSAAPRTSPVENPKEAASE